MSCGNIIGSCDNIVGSCVSCGIMGSCEVSCDNTIGSCECHVGIDRVM